MVAWANDATSLTLGSTVETEIGNGAYDAWRNEQSGWTIGGKYDIGALTLGLTYSSADRDNNASGVGVAVAGTMGDFTVTQTLPASVEETALVLGASYAIGGGLTTWIEYMDLGQEYTNDTRAVTNAAVVTEGSTVTTNDDSLFLIGVTLGF